MEHEKQITLKCILSLRMWAVEACNQHSYHFYHTHACHVSSLTQSIEELEKEMLNGQKLQGPATAAEVHLILNHKNLIDK